jgi:hypothetical protein
MLFCCLLHLTKPYHQNSHMISICSIPTIHSMNEQKLIEGRFEK